MTKVHYDEMKLCECICVKNKQTTKDFHIILSCPLIGGFLVWCSRTPWLSLVVSDNITSQLVTKDFQK